MYIKKIILNAKQLCDVHDFEYLGKGCTGIVAARHGLAYKFYYSFSLGTTEIPLYAKGRNNRAQKRQLTLMDSLNTIGMDQADRNAEN